MLQRILLVASLATLCACGTPGVQRSGSSVSIEQKPVAGEGYVLLRMQSARPTNVFNPKWQMLRVADESGRSFELSDISGPQSAGALFYTRLPAGAYRVTEVQTVGPGPGLLLALLAGDYQDLRSRELRFVVREGAL
ncbi:MAG TPA: hypothetical protein VLV90_04950, partial [Burkholderiales bacterium]|nr:hypothetical protein [Burkholderiales bacterium]